LVELVGRTSRNHKVNGGQEAKRKKGVVQKERRENEIVRNCVSKGKRTRLGKKESEESNNRP